MIDHHDITKHQGLPVGMMDITVAFHDLDVMNVVWHGNYIKYFEIARHEVLRKIDYDYPQMQASGYVWPVVDIRSRYVLPVTYGDKLQVFAIILEWEYRLIIKYVVINHNTNKVVTRGRSVQVPVCIETMSMKMGCPEVLREKIDIWHAKNPPLR